MRSIYLIVVSMFLSAAYAAEPAPATTQSLADQARALAGLADTAERQGITLPPGLFPGISAALSINANYPPAQRQALAASLADFSDQLRQEMSRPGMLGRTSIAVLGGNSPIAGGAISVRQQYTVGTTLGPGAAIMVAKHWMEPSPLQTDNAGGNDYVSVSAKSGVSFSARTMPRRGIYGGRYAEEPVPVFDVASGQIEQGTTITITYSRLRLPNRATDDFPLPVYVRLTSDGPFLAVPISGIPVQPGKLDKLSLYAPNVARTGQSFTVHAMLTDRFGNPVNGALPPLDLLVDGVIEQSIPGAADASPEIPLTLATAGLHQLELRSAGGGLVADARVDVEDTPGWTIRWVELHAHTRLSDGLQSADEVRQRLSGVVDDLFLVDHDNEMSDAAWRSRPAQTLDGFEWSGDIRSGGHRIVLSSTRFAFDRSPRLEFPTDADLTRDLHGAGKLMIALPEIPTDSRFVDPGVLCLVEIKAGNGTFEWLGNRFAQQGYRVGFTGSVTAHNHQSGPPATVGRTAVMVLSGEGLMDALQARRTYVTSGPRIMLDVRVNGGYPGERVAATPDRRISGRVVGTAGISRIDLIRNGEVIDSRDLAGDTTSETVRVRFFSSSAPIGQANDLPRNGREWIGYVKANSASVAGVDASAFRNEARQAAAINPADASRVDFITWTRGEPSSFTFDLAGDSDDTTLALSLKSGFEDNDEIPRARPPAAIASTRFLVTESELRRGLVTRDYDVDGYHDTVTFELVNKQPPGTATFAFADHRDHGDGDYYYVRVVQTDDQMAWSSPVWVGGLDYR